MRAQRLTRQSAVSTIPFGHDLQLQFHFNIGIDDPKQTNQSVKREPIEFSVANARNFRLANPRCRLERNGRSPLGLDRRYDLRRDQPPRVIKARIPPFINVFLEQCALLRFECGSSRVESSR